jgi:hypothetical protein
LVESANNNHHWRPLDDGSQDWVFGRAIDDLVKAHSPLIDDPYNEGVTASMIREHGIVVEIWYRESGMGYPEAYADNFIRVPAGTFPDASDMSVGDTVTLSGVETE